ncbi:class E sortase [Streptomyces luteolifulvus]|uniref:Class E sortase n=1 Tax=Streptomyces luteolifulvus TaxID=2615112 RepID=A0A6H9UT41_9ACTN|nr:class E sortase [Streptomyces luteolifulvus]KAB1142678.1 class E sortase [Streptomyces luteolifulvus]
MRLHVVHHGIRRRRARRRLVLWTGGEVLVTVGVLLLLLVVHQLWWTNREARAGAERKVEALEREWGAGAADIHSGIRSGDGDSDGDDSGDDSDDYGDNDGTRDSHEAHDDRDARTSSSPPRWSQAYAILTIPRLHLRVPVAEGIGKPSVLDKGYVGHYPGTQQPGRAGNFALAGHRNTQGEPFRYINRLARGDTVQVETKSAVYTYAVDRTLPQTSARDAGVLRPVPRSTVRPSYGYRDPGYYLTLTTCTPEYTSRYRLVVWGRLVSMRPR